MSLMSIVFGRVHWAVTKKQKKIKKIKIYIICRYLISY